MAWLYSDKILSVSTLLIQEKNNYERFNQISFSELENEWKTIKMEGTRKYEYKTQKAQNLEFAQRKLGLCVKLLNEVKNKVNIEKLKFEQVEEMLCRLTKSVREDDNLTTDLIFKTTGSRINRFKSLEKVWTELMKVADDSKLAFNAIHARQQINSLKNNDEENDKEMKECENNELTKAGKSNIDELYNLKIIEAHSVFLKSFITSEFKK